MSTNKSIIQLDILYLDQIMKIENESFPDPWTRDQIKYELIENPVAYNIGYINENQLLGYSLSHLIQEELHINNFAVDKNYRKKGLGEKLLNQTITLSGCDTAYLEVSEKNQAAINLYQKYGFKIFHKREKYYKDGSDAFIMIL